MIKLIGTLLLIASTYNSIWLTNIDEAKKIAKEKHKSILINFSGSDWCVPCMRTKKEIFENIAFTKYADSNLVLLNADFPRKKKNQQTAAQIKMNEALAEKYNSKGIFPFTILMDENGKVLKKWEGAVNVNAQQFVDQIRKINIPAK